MLSYDALNRLTNKTYSPQNGITNLAYTYDTGTNGKGRRTGMRATGVDATSWVYDLQGRVTSTSKTIDRAPALYSTATTSWTYDAMSRARMMTYPDGERVALGYNNQGLLQTLGGYVTGSNYSASSQHTSLTLGNNAVTAYTYNPQNLRLTNLTTSGAIQSSGAVYFPFGSPRAGNPPTDYTFTGQKLDRAIR